MIKLSDKISVPTQRTMTDSGQMIVPCAIARTGSQKYRMSDIGLEGEDFIDVWRTEEQVFADESIASFRSVPVTIGHPAESVTSENAKELQVGTLEGIPTRDEDLLTGTIVVARQDAIDIIEDGTVELSVGYSCNIELSDGKYYQTNIVANHIAIVERGRAGSVCSIADSDNTGGNMDKDKETKVEDKIDAKVEDAKVEDAKVEDAKVEDAKVEDSAEDKLVKLGDTVDALTASVDSYKEKLALADAKYTELSDSVDALVADRYEVISAAKDMTDKEDFKGMSVFEIKAFVVSDLLDIDLSAKTPAYVEARYDIVCEDSANEETPLGRMMRKAAVDTTVADASETYVDPAVAARNAMIKRSS